MPATLEAPIDMQDSVTLANGRMLPLPFGYDLIQEIIPHRYPFLLVDRVTVLEPGQHVKGFKNLSNNEAFFQGHFPDRPIMPGVLQIEALAQIAGVGLAGKPEIEGKLAVFTGIEKARFRRMVVPGDRLDLSVTIERFRPPIIKCTGVASVNGESCVEAEMMFALVEA